MPVVPPPIMQDHPKATVRLTAIHFQSGMTVVAPTDQWIACIFDVLHPSQQEAIIERIQDMAKSQQDRPLIEMPIFQPSPGERVP